MKWEFIGCHGRFYPTARDDKADPKISPTEADVQDFVYRQLVELFLTGENLQPIPTPEWTSVYP